MIKLGKGVVAWAKNFGIAETAERAEIVRVSWEEGCGWSVDTGLCCPSPSPTPAPRGPEIALYKLGRKGTWLLPLRPLLSLPPRLLHYFPASLLSPQSNFLFLQCKFFSFFAGVCSKAIRVHNTFGHIFCSWSFAIMNCCKQVPIFMHTQAKELS